MRFPVTLDVKPSRRLRAALVFVHVLACVAACLALPIGAAGLLVAAITASLFACWRKTPGASLTLQREGGIEWLFADGGTVSGCVLADSASFRWLTVLRCRLEGEGRRVRTLVLLADSLSFQEMRSLQVWLRWVLPFRKTGAGD